MMAAFRVMRRSGAVRQTTMLPSVSGRRAAVRYTSGSGGNPDEPELWQPPSMPPVQFDWLRKVLASPSPIGFEAGMTEGVIRPWVEEWMPESWAIRTFKGTASMVIDSDPADTTGKLKVMICGHADKIRMQVRARTQNNRAASFRNCAPQCVSPGASLSPIEPRNRVK